MNEPMSALPQTTAEAEAAPPVGPLALVVAWAQRRDERAFAALVERYAPMVRSLCRRVLRDPALAEDATQETFILLARHAARIRSNVGGWLMATARTAAIDLLQQDQARRRRELRAAKEERMPQEASPPLGEEELVQLDQAMLALPEGERGLLIDYFWTGRTQEEIGREAGVSQVAIKKRLDRALERLRDGLRRLSPAALLAVLAATAPSAESAGEGPLIARLGAMRLEPLPAGSAVLPWAALAGVAALVVLALLLLTPSRPALPPSAVQPLPAGPPPPAPAPVPAWSEAWSGQDISIESLLGGTLRADPGAQRFGSMRRPWQGDGLALAVQVEQRHCPFFGVALVPADGDGAPLLPVGIVPDPTAEDAGCWLRSGGAHRLVLRIEHQDGAPWMVCSIDGAVTCRRRLAREPAQAMLVVSSGRIVVAPAEAGQP